MVNGTDIDVQSVVDEDGAVILDIKRNAIVRLNSTGGFIWEKLQAGSSIEELVLALAQETKVEIDTVERDVREFLDDLRSKHLIVSRAGLPDVHK